VTETVTAKTEQTADWLRPTRGRIAVAALVAAAGFCLPQEVPLEWYPLNEPGTDINYLEISCAADKNGDVKIYYNLTRGINELHTIYWPISPTEQTFTYTFPLPDAPITELRVDPVADGGTLHIRRMRIINRRGEEIRRFTRDLFRPQNEIAAITPVADGWKITSTPGAKDPYVRIEMFSPIIPVGKDHRNLLRCLLSTGYLALMLWILLLAVMFTFLRPRGWRDLLPPVLFMAALALLFAPVGNRGLIRNSIHYARYVPPVLPDEVRLEFDLVSSGMTPAHLFWDRGRGVNGEDCARVIHEPHPGLQTLRFPLPRARFSELRFDPRDDAGSVRIQGIRLVDAGQRTKLVLPLDSLIAFREIAQCKVVDEALLVETVPAATDPILMFSAPALSAINAVLNTPDGAR
jgi:hypothetical protein